MGYFLIIYSVVTELVYCPCGEIRAIDEPTSQRCTEVPINKKMLSVFLVCRVVGGFETLTAMENVESDTKTDKPKVGDDDLYYLNR